MELAFTKLFNKIVTSSVWSEDDKTRIMWITLLALADRNGRVIAALPGLADVSRMSLVDAEAAIKKLESPDPYSRTKLFDGKRIIPTEGGWDIVTYDLHRALLSAEERKQYKAEWIKKRRQQSRQKSTGVDSKSTVSTQAEAEGEAKAEASPSTKASTCPKDQAEVERFFSQNGFPVSEAADFFDHYQSNGWRVGGRSPMKDWKASARKWGRNNQKGGSYGANQRNTTESGRGLGTANEGKSAQYAGVGKVSGLPNAK